jgi:hypothetical protein
MRHHSAASSLPRQESGSPTGSTKLSKHLEASRSIIPPRLPRAGVNYANLPQLRQWS